MDIFTKLADLFTRPAEPQSDAKTVDLRSTSPRDTRLTHTPGLDLLTPVPHSLPRTDPHTEDLRELLTSTIEALAASGSLDESTVIIADAWVDEQRKTWEASVRQKSKERRFVANSIVGQSSGLYVETLRKVELAKAHSAETEAEYLALRRALGLPDFEQPAQAPAVHPTQLRTLVEGSLVAYANDSGTHATDGEEVLGSIAAHAGTAHYPPADHSHIDPAALAEFERTAAHAAESLIPELSSVTQR